MFHNDTYPNCPSESTSVTDSTVTTTTTSEAPGWSFGLKEITGIARCLKESIPPAIDSFAETIHKSAMTIAAEFSELEKQIQRENEDWLAETQFGEESELTAASTDVTKSTETNEHYKNKRFIIPLPWEVPISSFSPANPKEHDDNSSEDDKKTSLHHINEYQEDSILKEKILRLSKNKDNFLTPFGKQSDSQSISAQDESLHAHFILDDAHLDLIRRLLIVDDNLTKIHARMRAHDGIKENIFWRNYFYHCDLVRESHLNEYDDVAPEDNKSQHRLILQKEASKDESCGEWDDGELVEAPPVSCTGYYTRSQNPSLQHYHLDDQQYAQRNDYTRTLSSDSLVLVGTSDEELKAVLL